MSNESDNARALYAFLEREWAAMGIKPTAWCRKVGLADATVLRWRDGIEPDMKSLKRVALALKRPLLDVLIEAGYVTTRQAGGYKPMERTYDVREAIHLDQNLDPGIRELLEQVLDLATAKQNGVRGKITKRGSIRGSA